MSSVLQTSQRKTEERKRGREKKMEYFDGLQTTSPQIFKQAEVNVCVGEERREARDERLQEHG